MIEVTPTIQLSDDELQVRAVRASGPGGQHVNKVSTAVELRFDVRGSPSLPEDVRARLYGLAGSRLTQEDRKSTRLNSSHVESSYAVFCLKKKNFDFERIEA